MEKVYYTDEPSGKDALISALREAFRQVSASNDIKTIVILFPTLAVADDALLEFLPSLTKGNRSMHCDNPSCGLLVKTLNNYSPNFPHVLISAYNSEKSLVKYEDEWDARIWVVIPDSYENIEPWLKVHSSENVATGQSLYWDCTLDDRVVNAIEWLWATSFPNEGFYHPLDMNRLKSMANALASKNVPLDYYSVLHYCINHKINHDGGRKIAEHFVNAQNRKYKTDGNYNLSFMTEMMNTKHKRI